MSVPHLLFICSRNEWRSRTAETVYRNDGRWSVRSAGTAKGARIRLNGKLLAWADTIYCMEDRHRQYLIRRFGRGGWTERTVVLHIPDIHRYMDPELIDELRAVVEG